MRLARLDHNPLAGIVPIALSSPVQQPQHVYIGQVLHPIRAHGLAAPTAGDMDVPLMLKRLKTAGVNNQTIAKACGATGAEVASWIARKSSPTREHIPELVVLYQERVSPHVPGVLG